jgi:hypothetical protein
VSDPVGAAPGDLPGEPSDGVRAVLATGRGDASFAVVSMSGASETGEDDAYLRWHLFDHLPEQYRLDGLRWGGRWRSTPACRAARAASEAPFDAVDHIVCYLFGGEVDAALGAFFDLGAALRAAGRMPLSLPRVQVGGWTVRGRRAAPRALVGADVIPWRPASGAYVIVEEGAVDGGAVGAGAGRDGLDELVAVDGVAGAWSHVDGHGRHPRLAPNEGRRLTVCHLDGDVLATAAALAEVLAPRWVDGSVVPLLAAPFERVDPWTLSDG